MNEASQETQLSSEQGATGATERAVSLSEAAAKRVLTLMESEENQGQNLRIAVSGGGCQGFSYGFSFDAAVNEDDHTFTRDGATLVVDDVSLDLLAGSEVDFVEDLMGAYFRVTIPYYGEELTGLNYVQILKLGVSLRLRKKLQKQDHY